MAKKKTSNSTSAPKKVDKAGKGPKNDSLDILKTKLRKKFALLQDDPLEADDLVKLKKHVCLVLAINMPTMNNILLTL